MMRDPYIIRRNGAFWWSIWNGSEVSACFNGTYVTAEDAYRSCVNWIYQPVPKLPIIIRQFRAVGLEGMAIEEDRGGVTAVTVNRAACRPG